MLISLLASISVAQASPAIEPAPPPASGGEAIVVTGEKPSKKAISDFIRALTPVSSSVQISRFEHSVCPAVFGLPASQARKVADRMRIVAKGADIAVGGEHCTPNVVVIVAADKKQLLEQLRKQRPQYFGGLSRGEVRKLEQQPGPAAAWQLAGPDVNADGVEIGWDSTFDMPTNRTVDPPSRITVPSRPQFDAAVVVVERSSLAGLTTTQLADYAAMRAYAGADPARLGNSGAPTILRVLEAPMGSEVPITMTSWDFSFLHGLYTSRRDLRTSAQRGNIGNAMAKDLHAQKPQQPK